MANFREQCFAMLKRNFPKMDEGELDRVYGHIKNYVRGKTTAPMTYFTPKSDEYNFISRVKEQFKRKAVLDGMAKLALTKNLPAAVEQVMNHPRDPSEGVMGFLVGSTDEYRGARNSVSGDIHVLRSKWTSDLDNILLKHGYMDVLTDNTNMEAIYREIYSMVDSRHADSRPFNQDRPKIFNDVARVIVDHYLVQLRELNKAGALVEMTPAKTLGLHFSTENIRAVSKTEFIDDITRALDLDRTLDKMGFTGYSRSARSQASKKLLDDVYESLRNGRHVAPPEENVGGTNTIDFVFLDKNNIQSKMSKIDYLIFKNADDHAALMRKYGSGDRDIVSGLIYNIDKNARAVGIMNRMGPNPVVFMKHLMRQVEQRVKDDPRFIDTSKRSIGRKMVETLLGKENPTRPEIIDALAGSGRTGLPKPVEWAIDEISGRNRIPESPSLHSAFTVWRMIQNLAKLGGAVVRSVAGDLPTMANAVQYTTGKPFLSALVESTTNTVKFLAANRAAILGGDITQHEAIMRLASVYGVMPRSTIAIALSKISDNDTVRGRTARIMRSYFRLNGLQWWTESAKGAFSMMLAHHFGVFADKELAQLDKRVSTLFEQYGISHHDWNFIRKYAVSDLDGRAYILPDLIKNIDNETVINEMLSSRIVDSSKFEALNKELAKVQLEIKVKDKLHRDMVEAYNRAVKKLDVHKQPKNIELRKLVDAYHQAKIDYEQLSSDFSRSARSRKKPLADLASLIDETRVEIDRLSAELTDVERQHQNAIRTMTDRIAELRSETKGRISRQSEIITEMGDIRAKHEEISKTDLNREAENIKDTLHRKWLNMFLDQNDNAVIMPGARERGVASGTRFGLHYGSLPQEIWANTMQFMSFPISVFNRVIYRDLKGGRLGNVAWFMATSVVLGTIAQTALDLASGKSVRTDFDPKSTQGRNNILDMLQASGFMGVYTDFLTAILREDSTIRDRLMSTALGAPTGEVIRILDDTKAWITNGRADKLMASLIRNTPFVNLFYSKQVMNWLIFDRLQEMADPGYKRKLERRLHRRTGQELIGLGKQGG